MADSVALLGWDEDPIRVVQNAVWLLDDRADSTNQVRVTTSLAEADGVDAEQELIFKSRRFTISGVERDRAADEAVITADEHQAALADVVIVGFRPNSWTLTRAMNAILDGTRWTLGEVSGTRYGRADFDEITALDALHFLARHQDAHLSFDSLRRRVNITQDYGTAHEYVFTYGRQLSNIEKDIQQPTTTVIYPTMADDVVLDPVEDYGYYMAQGLTRNEAHERFRKEEHWSDSRYEIEENMVRDAQKRLEEEAYPSITYTLTAQTTVDVEGADDFDLSELRLGDTVYVWDQEIDTKLSAEVTAVTTSSDQSQNELTLSTLPASLGDSVESRGYFGDSGKPSSGGPRRSGPQPRPSMPILEQMGDYGIAVTRWNGQDHDGEYTTIPQRFGTLLTLVAPLEDGVIPSPTDSSHTFMGSDINKRGGGTSSIGFNGYGEFAVWHQMRGWDGQTMSPLSEPLVVDVPPAWDPQPTVDKLDNLNDVRLPGLEQDLADAQQQADQRYSELDTRADTAQQNISDATDRLTAAETTLEPLPSDVAEAQSSATAAREAAEAAEARAIEASNAAGNRIDNGGFELGLDHWATTNVTLTSDAHSGEQAALIADGGSLSPESSIPVSGGDVWDVSVFGKASAGTLDIAVHELDNAGNVVAVVDSFTIEATGVWAESGRQRTTMPEGSERITFEVSAVGGDWTVDDIVMRDVTDVVRLEQAAKAAADKADAAQAKADAIELAQQGIEGRLDDAESTLTDKAESSELSALDQRLSSTFQAGFADLRALTGAKGRIWTEDTEPPTGVSYEWAGEPHASESIKRVDGVEVARNYITNPAFETGTHGWRGNGGVGSLRLSDGWNQMWGIEDNQIIEATSDGSSSYGGVRHGFIPAEPGQWVAFSALVADDRSHGSYLYAYWRLPGDAGDVGGSQLGSAVSAPWYPGARITRAHQVPNSVGGFLPTIATRPLSGGTLASGDRMWADRVHIAVADTEADALAQVSEYFDGDTPDDRANDLWINADGIPHRWDMHDGWTAIEDQRIIAAAQAAEDAQTTADSALSMAGQKTTAHYDPNAPTSDGTVEGDLWRQVSSSGAVEARWRWDGTTWQDDVVTSEVIDNLDVGKLTAGTAEVVETVTERLLANAAIVNRLEAEQGYVGGVNLENGAVTAEKVSVTDQLITDIFGANRALVEDELIVKGDLIANNADLINAAMQNLSVTERADFVNAFADELYADTFTARSSTVARQVVAARNLYNDPDLRRTDLYSGWEMTSNGIRKDGTGSTSGTYADTEDMLIPAQPGERFEVTVEANFSGGGHARVYTRSADSAGNYISGTAASTVEVPITGTHRGTFEAHEDAAYVYIGFFTDQSMGSSDAVRFIHARVESALDGRMIVNGLLQASTAELEELFFDTAVGNTIAAGTGEFLELDADQIRSNSWTGIVATGATFQTHEAANRGVKMLPAGLRGWDSSGNLNFDLSSSTGNMLATGQFRTAVSGSRAVLDADTFGGRLSFYRGNGIGTLKLNDGLERLEMVYGDGSDPNQENPHVGVDQNTARIGYRQTSIQVGGTTTANQGITVNGSFKGDVYFDDYIQMERGARVRYYDNDNRYLATVGQSPSAGSSSTFQIYLNRGALHIANDGVFIPSAYNTTSSTSANVFISSSGWLSRATSASRYKLDQQEMTAPDSVLDIPMIDWVDKAQAELKAEMDAKPRPFTEQDQKSYDTISLRRVPGVVAETVESCGGEQFVNYGPDGEIEDVMYDRLSLAQIQVLKRKHDALEQRVRELEGAA